MVSRRQTLTGFADSPIGRLGGRVVRPGEPTQKFAAVLFSYHELVTGPRALLAPDLPPPARSCPRCKSGGPFLGPWGRTSAVTVELAHVPSRKKMHPGLSQVSKHADRDYAPLKLPEFSLA